MFNLSVTPEFLAYLLAGLTAILFDWFPGLSGWYDALSDLKKREIMAVVLAAIVAAIYGGVCIHLFTTQIVCDQAGLAAMVQIYLLVLGINYTVHQVFKPTAAAKARLAISKGQGMVEYALILVLVAVVVLAALTFMGPLISNIFSTINASL